MVELYGRAAQGVKMRCMAEAKAEARSQKQVSRKVEVHVLLNSGRRLCNSLITGQLRQIPQINPPLSARVEPALGSSLGRQADGMRTPVLSGMRYAPRMRTESAPEWRRMMDKQSGMTSRQWRLQLARTKRLTVGMNLGFPAGTRGRVGESGAVPFQRM